MVQQGELGEREAVEGRELFLLVERGQRQGGEYRKNTSAESRRRERKRVETTHKGLNKKRRNEKGEGFNTIKTL